MVDSQQKDIIDRYVKKSGEISNLTRMMSFGLIGLCYSIFTSESPFALQMVNENRQILGLCGTLGVITIILDYANISMIFFATRNAANDIEKGFKYKSKGKLYKAAVGLYYAKQLVIFIAAFIFLWMFFKTI